MLKKLFGTIIPVFLFLGLVLISYPSHTSAQGTCGLPGYPCCPNGSCQGICSQGQCTSAVPSVISGPPLEGCGIQTAIGCIPVLDDQSLAGFLLRWGLGIAGGIALVTIGYSSFIIMTASGDPRKLQGGKDLLTAAITGLLLLVFSAFILRVAGADILGIF